MDYRPIRRHNKLFIGHPTFAVSVALAHEAELLIGVVHEVNSKEQFYASKSSGAFLNGRPIQVSQRTEYRDILIATGFPYRNEYDTNKLFTYLKE
ncbi:MAG: hypothetical protein HN488_06905, partial [Saprospiraceae bacterium]|nr:hypothetical protein [Saprospiraceae bacterium]